MTRRTLLLAGLAAVVAAPAARLLGDRGYDPERRRAYEALVEALLDHGSLPGRASEARAAADRLAELYADALPARRREIDAILDAIGGNLARRSKAERVALLRDWAAEGGERRALAARATALAGAAFGPADRPLTVVI